MFNKNKSTATSKFYNELPKEELYSGYLHKSPVRSALTNGIKSWRRRFFVLSKEGEDNYRLAYFKTDKKREKPLGEIDLSKVSLFYTSPEKHPMWEWIQKNFKCLPSSVLLLRVENFMVKYARDYFLIGENSEDVNFWHNELQKVVKTQPSQNKVTDDDLEQDKRFRAKTEPPRISQDCNEEPMSQSALFRQSAPIYTFISPPLPDGYYDIPRKFSDVISDDEEDDTEEQPETPEDNVDSAYMPMFSVNEVLQQNQQEEDACFQKNTSTNGLDSSQDLCDGADNPMKRNCAEPRCFKGSLPDFNGNCASTEMNEGSPNKSETHQPVKKEICINRNDLYKSLIFTQKEGKPCVSECKQTETPHLFHKGDEILAFNDLEIETVEEIHTFLKRFSKDEIKLTILRHPGSQPFHAKPCSSL